MSDRNSRSQAGSLAVARLLDVVARLRGPDGCPWDREQTVASLKPYLVEETYEVLDAVDSGAADRHMEELGDLLLQIVLHAQIRSEDGDFAFQDVAEGLTDKLVRRHPHVFGDVDVKDSGEVLRNWEAIKAGEKQGAPRSALAGVPRHLPALQRAQRVQSRASRVGFDWDQVGEVLAKVDEELAEVKEAMDASSPERIAEELGDLLFSVVNLARTLHIDAEDTLRATVDKFTRRFQHVETLIREEGRELSGCTLQELDARWEEVKRAEVQAGTATRGRSRE